MKWPEMPLPKRLTRESFILLLLLVTVRWPLAQTVKCFTCEGLHCVGEICEGRYCLVSSYASVWGQTHFGQATHVKGCINGSLLRRSIRSHCEVYSDSDGSENIKMCICNADYCNANIGDKVREQVEFVTCRCEGSHCGSDKECVGEYCSYVYDSAKKEVHRGCVNRSVPLIERKGEGACMRPPITGATVHSGALHQSTNVESCLCSEDYCNERKPKTLRSKKQQRRCRTKARLSWNDFPMETKPGHCYGDHCFKVEMTARQSGTHYHAEGCISFINEKTTVEELSEKGCVEFQSPSLSVKTCFDSQQEEHKTRKEKIVQEEQEQEGEDEQEEEEGEVEEEQEEKEEEEKGKKQTKQTQKTRAPKVVHEATTTEAAPTEPEEEEEYEDEEEEEEEEDVKEEHSSASPLKEAIHKQKPYPSSTEHPSTGALKEHEEAKEHKEAEGLKHEEEEQEEEEPEHVNDNTTLVVAFVVIMVIIAVAGLVWKCELHKKIFHSRYQTVAGM